MIFSIKLFQIYTLLQLLQLMLIQNIYADMDNEVPLWLVAIKIKSSSEWSHGTLMFDNVVLTSAEAVDNVQKSDITVMTDCEILLLKNSDIELCNKRNVSNIHFLRDSHVDNEPRNDLAILILNASFDNKSLIKIAEHINNIDLDSCFFVNWEFYESQRFMVKHLVPTSYKVSFLREKVSIKHLIHDRLYNEDIEYAISNFTKREIKIEDGYTVNIDTSKEYLGNPLLCSVKDNLSTYVQIGVGAGFLTSQYSNDYRLILGRYYIDVIIQRSKIMQIIKKHLIGNT